MRGIFAGDAFARPVACVALCICAAASLSMIHPTAAAAQVEGGEIEVESMEPSTEISGFRSIAWGTTEGELIEMFGDPVEQRRLETGLELLAYRDQLVGRPSLVLFGLLEDEGLVKTQEIVDVPGGDTCIEMIRSIHHQIDLQYPLIRPSEQAKNNTPDAICEAAPEGQAYWHRQWRDESTGSVITVSLASGSQQVDITYESRVFRDWADPEQAASADPLEDDGASTEVLEAVP